jgi:hypothetical protein
MGADFFNMMYEEYGQWAIINFVKERQSAGDLSNVVWVDCKGCEYFSPFMDDACLVCGGK